MQCDQNSTCCAVTTLTSITTVRCHLIAHIIPSSPNLCGSVCCSEVCEGVLQCSKLHACVQEGGVLNK